jgi:hypothetical protein
VSQQPLDCPLCGCPGAWAGLLRVDCLALGCSNFDRRARGEYEVRKIEESRRLVARFWRFSGAWNYTIEKALAEREARP